MLVQWLAGAAFVDGLSHIPGCGQRIGGSRPGPLHGTYRRGMPRESRAVVR